MPNSTIFSFFIAVISMIIASPFSRAQTPLPAFAAAEHPATPDYTQLSNWAAHPAKEDPADHVPKPLRGKLANTTAHVDVFFLHPTIFSGKVEGKYLWNASLDNEELNAEIDKTTIKLQASVFNAAGKIYAPRYRQAHLRSFFAPHIEEGNKALAFAYEDTKKAFLYYLEHENKGRPFILAGHSQGARHLKQLMQELVDGTTLQKQLVAAYIVGWGVEKDAFKAIPLGNSPIQTGCFLTWRTYNEGYTPTWAKKNQVCVNPLNWTTSDVFVSHKENKGAVLYGFNTVRKRILGARVVESILWVDRPHIFMGFLFKRDDYHAGDYNLFYVNVRENTVLRAQTYLKTQK
ncbi:MAG: DUF3089 domain-containing protein [Aureispira sp.]